jgi:hypothetical protein
VCNGTVSGKFHLNTENQPLHSTKNIATEWWPVAPYANIISRKNKGYRRTGQDRIILPSYHFCLFRVLPFTNKMRVRGLGNMVLSANADLSLL